jgi:lycopene beta-cyclase
VHDGNLINIGTAGGWTKASSGFTFQFIQKKTIAITQALVKEKSPIIKKKLSDKIFDLYDATLLNVLVNKKMTGRDVFYYLFSKQNATTILKFLDNETSLAEDLKILSSVPTSIFLPAALKELFSRGKK